MPSLGGSPAAGQDLATIEGVVTLDGKPLAGAKIIFHLADRQFVDATKLRELTGWEPEVDLTEGLRRTIDWYREHPDVRPAG